MDKAGRRPLLLYPMIIMIVILAVLVTALKLQVGNRCRWKSLIYHSTPHQINTIDTCAAVKEVKGENELYLSTESNLLIGVMREQNFRIFEVWLKSFRYLLQLCLTCRALWFHLKRRFKWAKHCNLRCIVVGYAILDELHKHNLHIVLRHLLCPRIG